MDLLDTLSSASAKSMLCCRLMKFELQLSSINVSSVLPLCSALLHEPVGSSVQKSGKRLRNYNSRNFSPASITWIARGRKELSFLWA
ncbi:hypothetical protein PABG_12256 [Paracoccidioides brasiliensis Pb03]|nr:hypothetical protein PABG_12256 [Paracoccidioides brasiliensis Pb03]